MGASAINYALITTSYAFDNTFKPIQDYGNNYESTSPLAVGAGQINPNQALDPGLVYNAIPQDFVNMLCYSNFSEGQVFNITKRSCSNPSAGRS